MFLLPREQRTCHIGPIAVGGQPGENPPLAIFSMFHKGDRILESRKEGKFDRQKARDYIKVLEELSAETGIPAMVAMVANSVDEMKRYIDFYLEISNLPFGIDVWVQDTRVKIMEYVAEQGLVDRILYNSITPWDKDIPGQVQRLKELGVKHVVIQAFDEQDQSPSGRLTSFGQMLKLVENAGFDTILVDTAVMNLPAIGFACLASRLIKEHFGWPAGAAASNGTWMWKESREKWGSAGFAAIDAVGQGITALLWNDFVFTGPIVGAPRILPALLSATLISTILVYSEIKKLPSRKDHPLYRHFGQFAEVLSQVATP